MAETLSQSRRGMPAHSPNLFRIVHRQAPPIAYILLVASLVAVSSAAVIFKVLHDVPPITLAAWRLQLTSLLLVPPAIYQYRHASEEQRTKALHCWWLLMASGACLALHFGAFVWGLMHTSVTHSLLFVTSTPLLMASASVVLGLPISRGEILGAVGGSLGLLVLCLASKSSNSGENKVTVIGDFLSLIGAIAIIGYLQAGRAVRSWMPIFLYALPVTATSAVLLSLIAVPSEHTAILATGPGGLFGYFASPHHFVWVLYLALGPGIVGHTGFNTLLKFFSPLVIAMTLPIEPLIGTVIAWIAGVQGVPGVWTWVGGAITTASLLYCTYCEGVRSAKEQKRDAVGRATHSALHDDESVELGTFTIVEDDEDADPWLEEQ